MAIVETLEVRFQADLGNLKVQISSIIAKLNALSDVAAKTNARVAGSVSLSKDAVLDRVNALKRDISVESRYQSKLKSTARAAKNAGKAVSKLKDGIGLHRLDEVNLLDIKKSTSSGGGGSSGYESSIEDASEAVSVFWKITRAVGASFRGLGQKAKTAFSGIAEGLNNLSGGVIGAIANGFTGGSENLAEILKNKISSALEGGFGSAAEESQAPANAASKLVNRMANGIAAKRAAVSQAAKNIAAAADFSSKTAETEATNAGKSLSQGFANGIASKLSAVKNSVSSIVNAAVAKIKEKLKINSPSKVTYAFGTYFGEGFSGGISASVKSVQLSAQAMAQGAAGMLNANSAALSFSNQDGGIGAMVSGAVNEALGNTNLVIPLNVDGVKLGEASIRGINRATRAAGRVLLEI